MPHLDIGAYLTIQAGDLGNDAITLTVPHNWPVGDYTVRVHAGVIEGTPAERRFVEFGTHPRNGRVLSTHEITGSIAQPQVIEIPLTLTKEHSDTSNRTIFIRERGTADHYTQTRRVFGEGKSKNGIGPELAIWVDWIEIERKTDTAKPAMVVEAKFNVGSNRQVGSVSAKGLNKVRYECEQANGKVNDYIAYTIDARERAQKWVAEVQAAAAKPENAEIVAKLKKESKSDAIFRRSWDSIPGGRLAAVVGTNSVSRRSIRIPQPPRPDSIGNSCPWKAALAKYGLITTCTVSKSVESKSVEPCKRGLTATHHRHAVSTLHGLTAVARRIPGTSSPHLSWIVVKIGVMGAGGV
jgi:hypothetical protein